MKTPKLAGPLAPSAPRGAGRIEGAASVGPSDSGEPYSAGSCEEECVRRFSENREEMRRCLTECRVHFVY